MKFNQYIYWIAWRNLRLRRAGGGLSFMTTISIAGVGIGVAALIIVLSIMGGFENDLNRKMLTANPNLEAVSPENANLGFSLDEYPLSKFREVIPDAKNIQPFTKAEVVLKQGKHMVAAHILGIPTDAKDLDKLWGYLDPKSISNADLNSLGPGNKHLDFREEIELPGIILGEDLASDLTAHIGEVIEVLNPNAAEADDLLSEAMVTRSYVLIGTFRSQLFNVDGNASVVSLQEGRKFLPEYDTSLDEENYVTGVAVSIDDPYKIDKTEEAVSRLGLNAVSWKKRNESLLFALKLEKFTMSMILALIVVVAAFSISGTMMMAVYYKKGQVALLRSLGISKQGIAKIFLAHGSFIGLLGILGGAAFGVLICVILDVYGLVGLPQGVYYLNFVPVKYLPMEYLFICISAFVFSLIAALYPAMTAANQPPAKGLRYL